MDFLMPLENYRHLLPNAVTASGREVLTGLVTAVRNTLSAVDRLAASAIISRNRVSAEDLGEAKCAPS